jgi:hypothetical protein
MNSGQQSIKITFYLSYALLTFNEQNQAIKTQLVVAWIEHLLLVISLMRWVP